MNLGSTPRLSRIFLIPILILALGIVSVQANPGYDFTITFFDVQKTDEQISVFCKIENTGDQAIESYHIEGTLTITSPSGKTVYTGKDWNVFSLQPGSDTFLDYDWTIPSDAEPGWYSVKIEVALKDTGSTKTAEKTNAFQVIRSEFAVELKSRSDDGTWTNLGTVYVEGEGNINFGSTVYKQSGSYKIITRCSQSYGGAIYSFDRWETSGSVSVSNTYKSNTVLTVNGDGTLTAVFLREDFELEVSPVFQEIKAGDTAYYTFTVSRTAFPHDGCNLQIDLQLSGLPAGTSFHIGSNPVSLSISESSKTGTVYIETSQDTPPGTYTITLKGTITGSETSHQKTITLKVNPPKEEKPDLIITDITWTPENPSEGDSVIFTYTEENQGSAEATSHRVTLYIDGKVISYDDVTDPLPPGASRTRTFPHEWVATSGTHEIFVKADSADGIQEENEDNNGMKKQIYVETSSKIPTTLKISISPSTIEIGKSARITISGKLLRGDTGNGIPGKTILLIWPGDSCTATTDENGCFSCAVDVYYTAQGTYKISASFEGDSYYEACSSSVILTVLEKESENHPPFAYRYYPDESEITLNVGDSITFTVRAEDSDGNLDGIKWYLDGYLVYTSSVSGSSCTDSWSHTFDTTGEFEVKARVYDNEGEYDYVIWKVIVRETSTALPDLSITGITLFPSEIYENDTVTFSFTVENKGQSSASDFDVGLYINGEKKDSLRISFLGAGQSLTRAFSYNWKAVAGNHTITVKADDGNEVQESDEENNEMSRSLEVNKVVVTTVTVLPLAGPPELKPSLQPVETVSPETEISKEEIFQKRMELYSAFAQTFRDDYWINKGNKQLEEFRSEFEKSFLNPFEYLKSIITKYYGIEGYVEVSKAMEEFVTLHGTIQCYAIGYKESMAKVELWKKYNFDPYNSFNDIRQKLERGDIKEAKVQIDRTITYLKDMKSEIKKTSVSGIPKQVVSFYGKTIEDEKGQKVVYYIPINKKTDEWYEIRCEAFTIVSIPLISSIKLPYSGGKYRVEFTLMDGEEEKEKKSISLNEGETFVIVMPGRDCHKYVDFKVDFEKFFSKYAGLLDHFQNPRIKVEVTIEEPSSKMFGIWFPWSHRLSVSTTVVTSEQLTVEMQPIIKYILTIGEEAINSAVIDHIDSAIAFLKDERKILENIR